MSNRRLPKKVLLKPVDPEDLDVSLSPLPAEAATLSGDIRDVLLTHARGMIKPWEKLSESEQADKIYAITNCAESVVRQVVDVIVKAGFPSLVVSVGAIKMDKGLEIKCAASSTVDNITKLAMHGQGAAALVLAQAADFYGERSPAKAAKDQPNLKLSDEDDDD